MKTVKIMAVLLVLAVVASAQTQTPASPNVQPNAQVAATYQISGVVVNAVTGDRISGAKVSIMTNGGGRDAREVLSSGDGRFAFDRVPPGKWVLMAAGRGFRRQIFEEHEGFTSAIVVGPGKVSTGVLFRVQPDAVITGQVIGAFSEPVGDGTVYLFREAVVEGRHVIGMYRSAQTDDQGSYAFKHVPAGRYYIAVSARPWFAQYITHYAYGGDAKANEEAEAAQRAANDVLDMAYPLTFYGDTTDSSQAAAVIARSGETAVANVAVTPVHASHVTVDGGSLPAGSGRGRSIMLRQTLFGDLTLDLPTSWSGTGNDGRMQLNGVAPGHYKLSLLEFGEGAQSTRTQEMDAGSDEVDLEMSDVPPASATVTGTLVLDNGSVKPPANGSIQLVNRTGTRGYSAKLGANGEFAFQEPVEPGRYEVWVVNVPRFVIRNMNAKGARMSGRQVTIEKNAGAVNITISASRGVGTITGTAMTGGAPMAGAMVVLVPDPPTRDALGVRRDQSDSDGTFTLSQVVPGRYKVLALRDWELEWNNPAVLRDYLAKGTSVVVQEKAKQDIRVEVQ